MIKHILIPTLGRINNQVTYNNLPNKYKQITKFVVQSHEFNEMESIYPNKVLCLPENIKNLPLTREWIQLQYCDSCYFVFDDDLDFVVKIPEYNSNNELKWKTKYFDEKDFDDAFELINKWLNDGYIFGGFQPSFILPNIDLYPEVENFRIMTNVFYNGPKIPKGIKWDRCMFTEDIDVELQLLTRGFKNKVSIKYMAKCKPTNTKGGCSEQRDLEKHNESQLKLASLWPNFVSVRTKIEKSGKWKGLEKINIIVQHKKAYLSSQINDL